MARLFLAPPFGRRRPVRWFALASLAALILTGLSFSRPAVAARGYAAPADPYAVPEGGPEKLIEFINKMRHLQPPKNALAPDKHSFLVRSHTPMLQAADKLLAADPQPGQRVVAFKAKYEAVKVLREPTGDEAPNDQQLTDLVKQLKDESDPELVKLFNQGTFTLKLSALARADKESPKVWEEIKAELTANPPDRAELQEVEEAARRIERFQTSEVNFDLLSKVYFDLLGIALAHPQPASADVLKRIASVAKRLSLVGKPIEIKGRTASGKAFDWSSMSGKVVLVEFWAASAPLSLGEIPAIKQALEKYHDKGFEVVGVSLDDDKKTLTQCIDGQKLTWINLFGESKATRGLNHPMAVYYGINGTPTGILVNRNGLVVSLMARGPNLETLLSQLFAKGGIASASPPVPTARAPGSAADPYEVPNGTPAALMAFIHKMRKVPLPDDQHPSEELRQACLKSRAAIISAADKILAAQPDADTRSQAMLAKGEALALTYRIAHTAESESQLRTFAEQLAKEQQPDLAEAGRRTLLTLRLYDFRGSPDAAAALFTEIKVHMVADPSDFKLLEMFAERMESLSESYYGVAADAYLALASIASKNPKNAEYVKQKEGIAHRLSLLGHPIEFQGTLLGGKPFDPDTLKGKVVLVDFWATWCGPCREELPNVLRNYQKYHDKGFEVIGVSLDNDKAELKKFLADQKIPWPILFSNNPKEQYWNHPMARYYSLTGIPTLFLANQKGEVVSLNARGDELGRRLEELLGK